MRPLIERIKSRKFIMALVAAATAFLKAYYPDFPDHALYAVVAACLGYAAIEGGIDAAAQLAKWVAEKKQGELK